MPSNAESSTTTASPTPRPAWDPDRVGAIVVVGVLSVCVVIVVATASMLAARGDLEPIAFLGLVTTLLAALTPSPLTKLRSSSSVDVQNAERVGPNA